jgi:glutathione-regulated potassium-efflux system ancillary protein KefG
MNYKPALELTKSYFWSLLSYMHKSFKRVLVIFAHPNLERSRINLELLKVLQEVPEVTIRDLYELYPDYQIDRQAEQIQLLQHDLIIWHHPFYWYSAPPLMKLWIDEVLEHNWAYGERGVMLKGKYAMNLLTAGGSDKAYQDTGSNHFTIREFLRPFEQTARLCHMKYLPPFAVLGAYRQNETSLSKIGEQLQTWIKDLVAGNVDVDSLSQEKYINEIIEEQP